MLDIKNLTISFNDARGDEAVNGVCLHMDAGEKLGLVGESGSGKTMMALTIAGLVERGKTTTTGEIIFNDRDILKCNRSELRQIQGKEIGMIFQEPMTSLNPLMRVGLQIEETLKLHTDLPPLQRRELALDAMERVGLSDLDLTYKKYPHQLSGGQRQRAMIASAIIIDPKLLIADEPTTALDVTVQSQILKLLNQINEHRGVGILFISHDLSAIRKVCTRVAVMYKGRIVEEGLTEDVFNNPRDEYTKQLIAAIPTRTRRQR